MDLQEKLALYFFDPTKGEEEYAKLYSAGTDLPISYSPLYLLRRQILLLTGKLITFPNPPIHQMPYFSAILLAHIAVKKMTMLSSGKDYVKYSDYILFYRNYMGLRPLEYAAARLLRNGIEHNNFQLYMRLKADSAPMFREFAKSFIKNRIMSRDQLGKVRNFNVTFAMVEKGYTGAIVSPPELLKFDIESGIARVQFHIQPYLFLEAFEWGVQKVKHDVKVSPQLQKHFDRVVMEENWMDVHQ
ncbi:hypothetical protein KKB10_00495 [Patescibacteria group bacterium]|nr:hypothetical protein [Patescibacteria group bacterium]MBU1074482.1 hypothetical protein [Patescibacteria group bacterium]MBU1951952.1 hypothetical protein [Patescibacteria group bacterium]